MTQNIDKAVDAVKGLIAALPQTERREFAEKISACFASSELTTVGGDDAEFDSVMANAGPGPLRPLMTPLQASASHPNAIHLMKDIQANARRLGFEFAVNNKRIDTFALDQALRGKDPLARMDLKAKMAKLHLIP